MSKKKVPQSKKPRARNRKPIPIDDLSRHVYDGSRFTWRKRMAKKNRLLREAAETIGSAMGRANRTAQKVAKAGVMAKKEREESSKQVESLKKQLQKTTKRLRKALA